jgi:hypothetical protein
MSLKAFWKCKFTSAQTVEGFDGISKQQHHTKHVINPKPAGVIKFGNHTIMYFNVTDVKIV